MKSLNPPSFHASASSALKSVRATALGAATSLFGLKPLNVDRRTRSGDGVAPPTALPFRSTCAGRLAPRTLSKLSHR